jgi:hypothetical protein
MDDDWEKRMDDDVREALAAGDTNIVFPRRVPLTVTTMQTFVVWVDVDDEDAPDVVAAGYNDDLMAVADLIRDEKPVEGWIDTVEVAGQHEHGLDYAAHVHSHRWHQTHPAPAEAVAA